LVEFVGYKGMGMGEVAFRKVPRIKVRSRQQQHFPLEVRNEGWEALLTYSSTFQNDE
jgi:hypothetical protein